MQYYRLYYRWYTNPCLRWRKDSLVFSSAPVCSRLQCSVLAEIAVSMSVVHSINVSEHSDRRVFSQSATQAPGRAILGEDRKLQFKYMRFVMYYICDLLKILGPLHGYFIAPLFWGKEGAKSMDYWPTTTRRALLT